MQRSIELKHVEPRTQVRDVLNGQVDRLERKLQGYAPSAISVHVVFEENRAHKLFRTSVTCHVPGYVIAAHEEDREAGRAIHEAFKEVLRQLDKHHDRHQPKPARRRTTAGDTGT